MTIRSIVFSDATFVINKTGFKAISFVDLFFFTEKNNVLLKLRSIKTNGREVLLASNATIQEPIMPKRDGDSETFKKIN